MSATGRGCVKTLRHTEREAEVDLSDRSVFDDRHLGRGKATPENAVFKSFHTASVGCVSSLA